MSAEASTEKRSAPRSEARFDLPPASALVWSAAIGAAVIVCWQLAHRDWMPTGDHARTWLSVMDIGGPDTPLLGAHSRLENGWFHPGPAQQFYLWLFTAALGGRFQSFLVAPLFTALAVVIALGLWLERLIGFNRASYFVAAYGLFCWGLGGRLIDAWNPMLLLCPLVLFVVACWALAMGRPRALPALLGLGSFVVQCHLGLLPITLATSATAACLYALARRRESNPGALRRSLLATACVFVLFWALPLWEQLVHSPGNMTLIWRSFIGPKASDANTLGWYEATRMVAAHLLPWGPWLAERNTPWIFIARETSIAWLALPVAALTYIVVSSRRRADEATFRLGVVLLAMLCASLFTMAEVRGAVFSYLSLFTRVIVMFWLGALAIAVFDRSPRKELGSDLGRSIALASVCILICVCGATVPMVGRAEGRAYQEMAPTIRAALPSGSRVRVRARGGFLAGADVDSLAAVVKATHVVEVVRPEEPPPPPLGPRSVEIVVASGAEALAERMFGLGRLVAEYDNRPKSQRGEADALLARLIEQMRGAGQTLNLGALDNPDRKARAELPAAISQDWLERYQAVALGPDRMHIAVFLIDAQP